MCTVQQCKMWNGWSTSWNQACWKKYQQPQICGWYQSNSRKWRGIKEPLDEDKRGDEKAGLKLNTLKPKMMTSHDAGPITSWQIGGEKVETVTDFIFLGSKIIADGDCSHDIKRCLLLGRKAMTNLETPLKSSDRIFLTKVCIVKVKIFPVVMYRC